MTVKESCFYMVTLNSNLRPDGPSTIQLRLVLNLPGHKRLVAAPDFEDVQLNQLTGIMLLIVAHVDDVFHVLGEHEIDGCLGDARVARLNAKTRLWDHQSHQPGGQGGEVVALGIIRNHRWNDCGVSEGLSKPDASPAVCKAVWKCLSRTLVTT